MSTETIHTEWVEIGANDAPTMAHVAFKESSAPVPAVIVLPTIHGANAYAEEVTVALAAAGYLALLIDIYAPEPPPDLSSPNNIRRAVQELDDSKIIGSIRSAVHHIREMPMVAAAPVGILGFCVGGTHALLAASQIPEIQAAVAFYGMLKYAERTSKKPLAPMESIADLKAPILYHLGDNDPWVDESSLAQYTQGLRNHNKSYELCVYPGAGHAFHERRKSTYRPVAAQLAWTNTLTFFGWHLKSQRDANFA